MKIIYKITFVILFFVIPNMVIAQLVNIEKLEGIYANEYGGIQLIKKNDTIMRTIIKNNEGVVFDTLMKINYDFKLKQNKNSFPFLQLNWGGLELQEECLYVREYSSWQYLASFIQIEKMYTRAFYKIDKQISMIGEMKFTKGGTIINGIYLKDYNKGRIKYMVVVGEIKKEKYPIGYYSTDKSPQGIFSDTSIAHYRLIMDNYEIKELYKQTYKGIAINSNNQAAFAWEFANSAIYFFDNKEPWTKKQLNKKIKIEAILITDISGKSVLKNWEIK